MTPRDTIKLSVLNYPLISQTNGEIQHHLFIIIGNGYEWVNGELVDEYNERNFKTTKDAIHRLFEQYRDKDNCWKQVLKRTKKAYSYFLDSVEKQVLTILKSETMFDEPLEVYFDTIKEPLLFDISRYSKIYDLPSKMTKEWYDCVVNFLKHYEPYIQDDNIEQQSYIKEIKEKLKTIEII